MLIFSTDSRNKSTRERKPMIRIEENKKRCMEARCRKPIVKTANLETIKYELYDMQSICYDVAYYTDNADGTGRMLEDMLGDEGETEEFKVCFGSLVADIERMLEEIESEYVPECFDELFVAAGLGNSNEYGGIFGWDEEKSDYMPVSMSYIYDAEQIAEKRIMRLSKKEMLQTTTHCLMIFTNYISIRTRFNELKGTMDLICGCNSGHTRTVKAIEELYEEAEKDGKWSAASTKWNTITELLPQECWIQ